MFSFAEYDVVLDYIRDSVFETHSASRSTTEKVMQRVPLLQFSACSFVSN